MNIHHEILVLIFSIAFVGQIYANDCLSVNNLVVESNIMVDNNKLTDKEYVKQILHKASEIDKRIRSDDYMQCENLSSAMEAIDENNTVSLKKVLSAYSWLQISTFGDVTVSDAWTIVQHSQDLNLQHKVLFIMEQLLASHEANKQQFALLYDRVALNYITLGVKQKYGTQYMIEDNTVVMQPCEGTIAQIDERRKDFGLPPVHEYEKILKSIFLANPNQASK